MACRMKALYGTAASEQRLVTPVQLYGCLCYSLNWKRRFQLLWGAQLIAGVWCSLSLNLHPPLLRDYLLSSSLRKAAQGTKSVLVELEHDKLALDWHFARQGNLVGIIYYMDVDK